jgi:lipoprotein-releasing system ATP-binding protein
VALIEVRELYKSFRHGKRDIEVLRGIDVDVDEGEMVSIVGASGVGKSTFLHVLGTLDAPTRGRILIGGRDVTHLKGRELARFRNRTIGFVFQFHHLLAEFTALENTILPGLIAGRPRSRLVDKGGELLAEVGLGHRLTHRPGELSGGEQQRVALARALVMDPALVLADEPTGNLDHATSEPIHDLIFKLNERHRTTMILVTHNPDLARRLPRRLVMIDGVIHEHDERAEAD